MGQLLGVFSVGNSGMMIFQDQIRNFDKKRKSVFFAEKRVLRERFKVALKEIAKKIFFFGNFFHRFRLFCLDTFWYDNRY